MPTYSLGLGTHAIVQNQIYALPVNRCLLFVEGAPTIQQSNTIDFTANKAVTLDTNNEAELSAGFIRCTSGNITISLKRR
jgi:hypothetical protein